MCPGAQRLGTAFGGPPGAARFPRAGRRAGRSRGARRAARGWWPRPAAGACPAPAGCGHGTMRSSSAVTRCSWSATEARRSADCACQLVHPSQATTGTSNSRSNQARAELRRGGAGEEGGFTQRARVGATHVRASWQPRRMRLRAWHRGARSWPPGTDRPSARARREAFAGRDHARGARRARASAATARRHAPAPRRCWPAATPARRARARRHPREAWARSARVHRRWRAAPGHRGRRASRQSRRGRQRA